MFYVVFGRFCEVNVSIALLIIALFPPVEEASGVVRDLHQRLGAVGTKRRRKSVME